MAVGGLAGSVVTPIQPGMVSKYGIDYSPPHSDAFKKAVGDSSASRVINFTVEEELESDTKKKSDEMQFVYETPKKRKYFLDDNTNVDAHKVVHGTPAKKAWERMKMRNKRNLLLDKK